MSRQDKNQSAHDRRVRSLANTLKNEGLNWLSQNQGNLNDQSQLVFGG